MTRVIRKDQGKAKEEVRELLASLLVLEALVPSRCLWVTSPWITDFPVIDNRFDTFDAFADLGARRITFSEVLITIARRGGFVVVATSEDPKNVAIVDELKRQSVRYAVEDRFIICVAPLEDKMHGKCMVADDFVLEGSMNFTRQGVLINEEVVELHREPALVAGAQRELFDRFGGRLS